jgi:hypothetical protein
MRRIGYRHVGLGLAVAAVLAGGSGCTTISPTLKPMTFLATHEKFQGLYAQIYGQSYLASPDRANVLLTCPSETTVRFAGGGTVRIGAPKQKPVSLRPGVYPLQLRPTVGGEPFLSGAVVVYNLDPTVSLATLGKTDETRMFSEDLLQKAKDGQLASHTISIDDRDVITYWLGNRRRAYQGGEPTVELDFSGTPGITLLKVGAKRVSDHVATVLVYKPVVVNGMLRNVQQDHPLEIAADGNRFHGYIRNLRDNEFTAFVRIPCAIPQRLLDAAKDGTVAKFTVRSSGDRPEDVAEIVLSAKQ